jgi:NADPH:quinone reductase-like Zn-dependent oxidoreductase
MGTQDESRQIVAHVASGALRPLLSATFPLADMVQAQQAFQAKTHFGKLAIVP